MAKAEIGAIRRIIYNALTILLFILIFNVLGGVVLYFTPDPLLYIDLASYVILMLAGVGSSFAITRGADEGRRISGIVSQFIVAIIFVIASIFFGGFNLNTLLDYGSYLLLSVLLCVLFTKKRARKRVR